ncbi:LOW QUALITY PROTEIN: uncharacterized protein LOC108100792 [Drosophila ficusphila]|uniref:LOW QUALITY PROTEIN: uncharacterized protein LOC108100792 n=1 Tax=Drosophila ficusphila TaxID=30025 RepID=UPI001C891924|nr:LOW QUALITY PROTEIN: uncharacterized protein LOC108100792 [Drosophila ficusphila]
MKRLRRQRTRTQKKMHDAAPFGRKLTLLRVLRVWLKLRLLLALQGWQLSDRVAQSNISVLAFFCPLKARATRTCAFVFQ